MNVGVGDIRLGDLGPRSSDGGGVWAGTEGLEEGEGVGDVEVGEELGE